MNPKQLKITDFDYAIPDELIALYPNHLREGSRLLTSNKGVLADRLFTDIPELLPKNALLVFNNTKVIPARIIMAKPSGGKVEIMLLRPHEQSMQRALSDNRTTVWECLVGGAKKWKEGAVYLDMDGLKLQAWSEGRNGTHFLIRFQWSYGEDTFGKVLERVGRVPLPPYISRDAEESDKQRYQTVFARVEGSVAAPTAGLHFTPEILKDICLKGIETAEVTLHVSAGTFLPVTAEVMSGHDMHAEVMEVNEETIQRILHHQGPVIAVGTTACRTLESLYWLGCQVISDKMSNKVGQWEPYQDELNNTTMEQALNALHNHILSRGLRSVHAETSLMIAPGYKYKLVKGLFTNFHQPKSTLLLLVAALIGDEWKNLYSHAIQKKYRFFSYGDACLLLP